MKHVLILLLLHKYFFVYGVHGVDTNEMPVFVMKGGSVTLHTDVKTNQQEAVRWYFNDILIAEIPGNPLKICSEVQCKNASEKFRGRLKVDHQTGSLTITNTIITDSGCFSPEVIINSGSYSNRTFKVAVRDFLGFGSDGVSAFVMEGDAVTLYTDVKANKTDHVNWLFQNWWNHRMSIAQITDFLHIFCTDVKCHDDNERFRGRLEMDHQTGSLTIKNARIPDSGLYHLDFSKSSGNDRTFSVTVYDVPGNKQDEMKRKIVKEGESVTLDPKLVKKRKNLIMWYFNEILIAEITRDLSKICTDDQCDGRFRNRLKVDHQTGSLIITNTRTTDSGVYKLKIRSRRISIVKIFSVYVTDEVSVSVMEGDSVTLCTDAKTNQGGKINWYYDDAHIVEMIGDQSKICTDVHCKKRFRERLTVNHQTGSLTIMNIRTTDSGAYKLLISGSRFSKAKIFSVSVATWSAGLHEVSVMDGDSVILHTDVKANRQQRIKWIFNDAPLAQIIEPSYSCTDVQCENGDERFRGRLELDHETGSLTIKNMTAADSGVYELVIFINNTNIIKEIRVTVTGVPAAEQQIKRTSMKEGESVTLETRVAKNQNDVLMWYFNDILIAELTGDQSKICADDQCDERFRDRLKVDQTGSLTITNTRTTDSGLYKLQISSNSTVRITSVKHFSVIVTADVRGIYAAVGGVLLLMVAVVILIYSCKCQSRRNYTRRQRSDQVNPVEDSSSNQADPLVTNTPNGTSPRQTST